MTTKRMVRKNDDPRPRRAAESRVDLATRFGANPELGSALEDQLKHHALRQGVRLINEADEPTTLTLHLILLENANATLAEFRWSGTEGDSPEPRISGSSLIPLDANAETAASRLAVSIADDLAVLLRPAQSTR